MSRALIFAGTTEGRLLAERMEAQKADALVSVATEYGQELLPEFAFVQVRRGKLNQEEIENLIRERGISAVIDATHPYAADATRQIRAACRKTGVPLARCLRKEGISEAPLPEGQDDGCSRVKWFSDLKEAVLWLKGQEGRILAATGSKELKEYAALPDFPERVFARVLPTAAAVEACRGMGLAGSHILALQGPFSVEMNRAMLEEYGCRFLVTKDGGREGGMPEKLEAAARAGATAVVIQRPKEEGGMTVDEVMDWYGKLAGR